MSLEAHHRFILDTMQRNQDIARNIINELEAENARLKYEAVHNASQLGEQSAEIADLKSKIKLLEQQVNYWRIEAEVDHGRWQRCLEDLEHLRRLK